jgi:hypothetical protein
LGNSTEAKPLNGNSFVNKIIFIKAMKYSTKHKRLPIQASNSYVYKTPSEKYINLTVHILQRIVGSHKGSVLRRSVA